MLVPYEPTRPFDAKQTLEVWLRLVADEELYDAMLENRHADVARARGLTDEEILIIEDFRIQPGTRWHMENLRFRCTSFVAREVQWHLGATMQILTKGDNAWLRDLAYEYLSYHRWVDLGHHRRLAECHRFARFIQQRIIRRRRAPEHLDVALSFDLAVLELLQSAGTTVWPTPTPFEDGQLGRLRPRRGPVQQVLELPVDIAEWLSKPKWPPTIGTAGKVHVLVWMPGSGKPHKIARLDAATRELLDRFDGATTVDAAVDLNHAGADRQAQLTTVRRWLSEGVLLP